MSTEPLRVLIVDDTPDIRMLLTAALGALGGFDLVGEAADGAEAVQLAQELQPDAILLDLAMPVMDGLQATPEIRKCSPQTRIIILSGFSKDRLGSEALAVGADAYIEKGTSPRKIAEIVREVCGTPRPQPDLGVPGSANDDGGTEPTSPGGLESWRRSISMAVEQVGELGFAFSSFGRAVRSRVDFDRAGFALSEADGYRIAAVCGSDDGLVPVGTLVPVLSQFNEALDGGTTITIGDTYERQEGPLDMYFLDRGVRSYAAVPVRAAGRAQAIVSFASERPQAFPRAEVDYLESAVREAAAAFHILWHMGQKAESTHASEEAQRAKLEWNRIIRHDLRSPLTVISGFAETMRSAWSELPDAQKLDFVDAIARGADAMTTLLSDMDQVDRLESGIGSLEPRPMKLCALIAQTVNDLHASTGRLVVTTIDPDLPLALADENDQRRVLSNLLENAFKFSDESEPVEVNVFASGGMIHVAVKDHGPGIAPTDQPSLFNKFSRAAQDREGPKVPGSGLGLYIARSIVEAHGGRIWVESEPGTGATFHYTIPAATA
ncbi:MAG: ATP-binding protein [Actinomycetota bacterium]